MGDQLRDRNVLDLVPVRLAGSEEVEGRVVLIRPKGRGRGLRGLFDRFASAVATPRIRLDELGSAAWRLIDGERSAAEIAAALRTELGEQAEPAEERLGHFVRTLHHQGLVAYRGIDD